MFTFSGFRSDQTRQIIDTEQVFDAWRTLSNEFPRRFSGSMAWKTVANRAYLYRKTSGIWKSLGPRTAETEHIFEQFHKGRQESRERLAALAARLNEMAAINRAMRLGRVPATTARILRALDKAALIGSALDIVGTNALFAYERLCGVRIESGLLATGDIDLLFDARTNLDLLRGNMGSEGLMGVLRTADSSFEPLAKRSFRAANEDGYLVDLIGPAPADPLVYSRVSGLSDNENDLAAVEIQGLQWLVNSPKVMVTVLDERGYPLQITSPDPRSFAIHKLWLSKREDRDPLKKSRDEVQAKTVAQMVHLYLPHLRFDDDALGAIPKSLRKLSKELVAPAAKKEPPENPQPDW